MSSEALGAVFSGFTFEGSPTILAAIAARASNADFLATPHFRPSRAGSLVPLAAPRAAVRSSPQSPLMLGGAGAYPLPSRDSGEGSASPLGDEGPFFGGFGGWEGGRGGPRNISTEIAAGIAGRSYLGRGGGHVGGQPPPHSGGASPSGPWVRAESFTASSAPGTSVPIHGGLQR